MGVLEEIVAAERDSSWLAAGLGKGFRVRWQLGRLDDRRIVLILKCGYGFSRCSLQ